MAKEKEFIITQLNFPENVRKRSGMYLGSLENSDVLLREIVDNAIDELYSNESNCDSIWIWTTDNYHIVADNGRGIPIRKSLNDENMTMAVQSVTSLHSGSKFQKDDIAIGLNGVGSSAVQAVSSEYHIYSRITEEKLGRTTKHVRKLCKNKGFDVTKQKVFYHASFEKGYLIGEDIVEFKEIEKHLGVKFDASTMTVVAFIPDDTIVESKKANLPPTLKFLNYIMNTRGREATVYYNSVKYVDTFHPFEHQFQCMVKSRDKESLNPKVEFLVSLEVDRTDFQNPKVVGSVNGLTVDRGYHVKLSDWAFNMAMAKIYNHDFKGYALWGIKHSVVLLAPEPAFTSQTKENCSSVPGITQKDLDPLVRAYTNLIKENQEEFDAHVTRVLEYISTLKNISKIDLIKAKIPIVAENARAAAMIPYKVKDCTTKDREKAELFLCFSGDTLVRTNIGDLTFEQLTEECKEFKSIRTIGYDFTEQRRVDVPITWCGVTGGTIRFYVLTYIIDGVEHEVKATLDHKFLLRSIETGETIWAEVQSLEYYKDTHRLFYAGYIPDGYDVNDLGIILSVREEDYKNYQKTYCLRVAHPDHNFALASGIVVHNCEGRSAGDNLVQGRNIDRHAVLGLRGKVKNSSDSQIDDLLDNAEIHDIIAAIGVGVDDYHNLSEVRYGKIIILADSDPDGNNITALLLGLFISHMKFLIDEGYVYVCEAPLYEQDGKYFWANEKDGIDWNRPVVHFKGLGELTADQLKVFAFDEKVRRLIKVTPENMTEGIKYLQSGDARQQLLIDDKTINFRTKLKSTFIKELN